MSPIASRSLRAERLTIGEALRRLGRFWWVWKLALRWMGATAVGGAIALAFGSLVLLSHRTDGVTPWKVGLGIGVVIFAVSSIGALLMTARATAWTRRGFEPRLA